MSSIRSGVERLVCVAGLLAVSPLLLAIAIAILIEDGRPIFFSQTRVGKKGVHFVLWKLRSMRVQSAGPIITSSGDRRVTRVGRILRKWKVDEIPQLFNVIAGDMNLVGPRPEVPQYVDLNNPAWRTVLQIRPGITEMATLVYRNEEEILGRSDNPDRTYRTEILPEKLRLNIAYMRGRSFRLDCRVLALTVWFSLMPSRFDQNAVRTLLRVEHNS